MNNKHDWNIIYHENAPRYLSIIRRYVGDNSLAEDILHDSFVTAMKKEKTFIGSGSIEGWVRAIVINTTLQHLRKDKKEQFALHNMMATTNNNPLKSEEGNSLKSKIKKINFSESDLLKVIDLLPMHHKLVFNLYVIEKYKHKEIGEMLGISPGTSKSHLARGRKKVQKLLYALLKSKGEKEEEHPFYALLFASNSNKWEQELDHIFYNRFSNSTVQPTELFKAQNVITQLYKSNIYTKSINAIKVITISSVIIGTIALTTSTKNKKKLNVPQKNTITNKPDSVQQRIEFITTIKKQNINTDTIDNNQIKRKKKIKKKPIIIRKKVIIRDTIYEYN